jgi:hypothetical protein
MTLVLNTTETIRGVAGTASAVTCTITGAEISGGVETYKVLYQGQLPSSAGTLYTVPASTMAVIRNINLTNATGSAVLGVILYVNGTAAVNQICGSTTIPAYATLMRTDSGWVMTGPDGIQQQGTTPQAAIHNRNILINPGFTIKQRAYASGATLAAGVYGHDRWKAGAGGGDYTFTQLAGPTTITIASGKTLIQVVEDKNVLGGTYILSWAGTAQARYGLNSATPSGSYAASPIIISGQSAGTTMSVEFNAGSLGTVQLELGSVVTAFEFRPFSMEQTLCKRYFQSFNVVMISITVNALAGTCIYPVEMQTTPTFAFSYLGVANTVYNILAGTTVVIQSPTEIFLTSTGLGCLYDAAFPNLLTLDYGYEFLGTFAAEL